MKAVHALLGLALCLPAVALAVPGDEPVAQSQQDPVEANVESATPEQMRAYALKALQEVKTADANLSRLANSAPECVRSSRQTMPILVEVTSHCNLELDRHLNNNDTERAVSEIRKIQVALRTTRRLYAEAVACEAKTTTGQGVNSSELTYSGQALGDGSFGDFEYLDGADSPPQASPFS